jgi:hypothetical protein
MQSTVRFVEQGYFLQCHSSKAVYIGDDPTIKRIQHAIYIDVTPVLNATKGIPPEEIDRAVEHLYGRLAKYRESNLAQVCRLQFNPTGVSPETGAVAKAFGSCIVDSPALQATLLSVLAPRDREWISERRDTPEALVVEAVLALGRKGVEQLYAQEIAVEVNRLLEARGNGLLMDKETRTRVQTLSAM